MYTEFDAYREQLTRKATAQAHVYLSSIGFGIAQHLWDDPETRRCYVDEVLRPLCRKLAENSTKKTANKDWARKILENPTARPAIAEKMAREALGQPNDVVGNISLQSDLGEGEKGAELPDEPEPLF